MKQVKESLKKDGIKPTDKLIFKTKDGKKYDENTVLDTYIKNVAPKVISFQKFIKDNFVGISKDKKATKNNKNKDFNNASVEHFQKSLIEAKKTKPPKKPGEFQTMMRKSILMLNYMLAKVNLL